MKNKSMKTMTEQNAQYSSGGKSGGWQFRIYAKFIDDEYLPLLKKVGFVYFTLAKYAHHNTRKCWPSYKTIMKKSGVKNKSSISVSIKILEALRFIEVKRSVGRKSNEYKLLGPEWWMPVNGLARETVRTVLNRHKKRSQKPAFNGLNGGTGIVSTDTNHLNKDLDNQEYEKKRRELVDKMRIKRE